MENDVKRFVALHPQVRVECSAVILVTVLPRIFDEVTSLSVRVCEIENTFDRGISAVDGIINAPRLKQNHR